MNRKYVELERQYKVCNFRLKERFRWLLKRKGDIRLSLKRRGRSASLPRKPVSFPCVFPGRHRRKICANSLWLYSYFTQTSPSKNKNINYIFINLQVLRCLSSVMICDTVAWDLGICSIATNCTKYAWRTGSREAVTFQYELIKVFSLFVNKGIQIKIKWE